MNKFLKRFLQGLLLGAALITAVGGGTTAVLIGVYDEIIEAVADLMKNPKKSLQFIIPMALGGVIGIVALILPIRWFMGNYPFITLSLFVGLTLGGLNVFIDSFKKEVNGKNLLFTLAGFLLVFALGAITWFINFQVNLTSVNLIQLLLVFFVGFFTIGAHMSPGLSGTLLLIAMGYFAEITDLAIRFVSFSSANFWFDFGLILSFGVGAILGLILISKLYKYSFTKSRVKTNFTITGFIIGSISIVYFNGQIKPEYAKFVTFDYVQFIICIVLIVAGFLTTNFLLKRAKKEEIKKGETALGIEE